MKYFDEEIDYPRDVLSNPIPWNVCWNYISSTFLNGFVNYVDKWICGVVLDRYISNGRHYPPLDGDMPYKDKMELISDFNNGLIDTFHTELSMFEDDIVLLGKTGSDYIWFWFDMDVSDCCICKFKTDDSDEEVIEEFKKSLNKLDFKYHIINVGNLKGWMNF